MPTRGTLKKRAQKEKENLRQQQRETESQNRTISAKSSTPPAVSASQTASLNTNKKDKLRYPKRDQDLYQGQVRFRIVELSALTGAALSNLNFVDNILSSDSISKLDNKIDKVVSSNPNEIKKRTELANKSAQKLKGSAQNSYENPAAQKKYGGDVTLYLPTSHVVSDAVQYTGATLGTMGAGVEAGLQNGGSAIKAIGAGLTQGIDSFTSLFNSAGIDKDAAALALTRTAETFGTQEISAGVKSATRVTANPNLRMLLESVPVRTIPFTFRLIAQSQDEAIEIQKIVEFFRYQLYPDEITGTIGGAEVSLGYKFPDPFEITTTYKGKRVGNKFLDAYLTTVTTTYNENGMGFHSDGYPSDVSIQLAFSESKALTRKLVNQGY